MISGTDAGALAEWQREVAIPAALDAGCERATAFRNLRPDESRFPRKIDEFDLLTVYETDGTAPASLPGAPAGATVRRTAFHRYPRASQGRLTGKPTTGVFLILISPTEHALAQDLRDWADFVHISYIAASSPPGFTTITPYRNAADVDPLFMHFYELDTDDPVAAVDEMPDAVCKHWGFELGDEPFMRWAMTPSLDIWYVNVFGRLD